MKFYKNLENNLQKKSKFGSLSQYSSLIHNSINLNMELLKNLKQSKQIKNLKHFKEIIKKNEIEESNLNKIDNSKNFNDIINLTSNSDLDNMTNLANFKQSIDTKDLKDSKKEFSMHSHSVSSSKVKILKKIFHNFTKKSSLNSQGVKIQNNDIVEV